LDNFLKLNGAEFVKEAGDIFRDVGHRYRIQPELLVCIAQADSSLGRYLKTSYNIGNVGNNDRGSTVHYSSLEEGIEAMGKVLNNKYLGNIQTIGQLSRGGGGSGYVYATSSFNWNNNVKLCMQNIMQDKTIDEYYRFRN
jgi:hypothetical protein